jgi:iron only hydrogenase large subunit-like protein
VFCGLFDEKVSLGHIHAAFIELGFTHIYEVENSVDILSEAMADYLKTQNEFPPLISCFCPAIVRLIQVKFPALTEQLMLLKQPVDLSSIFIKKKLMDEGFNEEDIGLFYVTPCAAKIAAIKSPVGEEKSVVTGVLNMNTMYSRVMRSLKSGDKVIVNSEKLTPQGIKWPLNGGESVNMPVKSVSVDGIKQVIEFLEKIENEEITDFEFLELRACHESCAGGILVTSNPFLIADRLRKRAAAKAQTTGSNREIDQQKEYILANSGIEPVDPRMVYQLDNNMARAMAKMKKVRNNMCYLPGFDCGVCGAPSCQALAEDVAKGNAHLSDCLFLQRQMERHGKLAPDHAYRIIENIWGKNRLGKNCNKKGADNNAD